MLHFVARLRSQVRLSLSLGKAVVQPALLCPLIGILCSLSSAQYTTGLPTVGNAGSPKDSQTLIDAKQFFGGTVTDMCGAVAAACATLGTTNYPLGATIDARGFTGNQVCAAANITTMLNGCVSQYSGTRNATGGKLLLGEVNLYADGPIPPATNYTYGTGSGPGTPALVIPAGFWGIEGVSRGADPGASGAPGPGTFLSVCTGSGTPVTGCNHAFPVRSLQIQSTTVVGNTMTMTVSPAANFGVNIYPGELVMMQGNTVAPTENGTYKVQNTSGSTVQVTVPSTTPACNPPLSPCGTLYLGTPILGYGPSGTNAYNTQACSLTNPCNAFGEHIKTLGFNCQTLSGCIGWQNLYAEEESGADTFQITNFSFVGFDVHGLNAQNFGPILNAVMSTGTLNTNCDYGTTGAYLGDTFFHGFDSWTIGSPSQTPNSGSPQCGKTPIAAVLHDAPGTLVSNGHCELFSTAC